MVFTEKDFLNDIKGHQLTIIQDNGVHRHLRFRNPLDSEMHFELITWPGYLCYTGDMGTFVFRRITDMFEFFSSPRQRAQSNGKDIVFDYRYWAQKLEAGKSDAIRYSPSKFIDIVRQYMDQHACFTDVVREAVECEVMEAANLGQDVALHVLYNFKEEGAHFEYLEDIDPTEFTHQFVWCCYALSWGIERYEVTKRDKAVVASATDELIAVPRI
jgi:hypothetical protein